MFFKGSTTTIAIAMLACASTSFAAPPWARGEGHGHGHGHGRSDHAEVRHGGGPPPWAPAHGYRAGREPRGYHEDVEVYERRTREFGIGSGTCNRDTVGAVLGGVVGGVVGSHVGSREQRDVATVAGVVVGALIGHEIGRQMDREDRACTGQVLERAADHETVRWHNPQTGAEYLVTPQRTFERGDRFCRTFSTVAALEGARKKVEETACRSEDGSWRSL